MRTAATTTSRVKFEALGTQIEIFSDAAESLATELQSLVAVHEARFSRFLPHSELQRICRAAGREVIVSSDMFEVLALAARFWNETGGIFDPLIRPSLEAAGYDRTFGAVEPNAPEPGPPPRPLPFTFGDVQLNTEQQTASLRAGSSLDLGGIAKAWIIDRLGDVLAPYGACLVDVGGDMVGRSDGPDGGPGWLISVADPFFPEFDLCWLRLRDQSIATSTTMRRRWQRNGRWQHHLIDPRTGAPAREDIAQVTVIAPTTVEADVYAKSALILGAAAGIDWLEARELPALLISDSGPVATLRWARVEVPMASRSEIEKDVAS